MSHIEGTVIYPLSGGYVINYPEWHLLRGRSKNIMTNRWYKKMVRVMKNMRRIMEGIYPSASPMSSFGLESLVWNVPDDAIMQGGQFRYNFDDVVGYHYKLRNQLRDLREANGIKYLCPDDHIEVQYCRFITDLREFYEYES